MDWSCKKLPSLVDALNNPYYNYKDKIFNRDVINQYGYLLEDGMDLNKIVLNLPL